MWAGAWLFLGFIGVLATLGGIFTPDNGVAILSNMVALITWGVWSMGTLHVEVVGSTSSAIGFSMPAVTIVGVMFGIIPLFLLVSAAFGMFTEYGSTEASDL